jgi:ABC-type transport system involved in multi-copper enzyme maturation permease subunit
MTNVLTITWLTFHEAWRRRMVQVALVLGVLFLLLYGGGLALILQEVRNESNNSEIGMRFGYNLLTMAGFYVVHFLTVMLAIFSSVDTISGEIATHTIQTIVTKPIRRWQVLSGKWLGFALMMAVYLGMLTGGILIALYLVTGYTPPNPLQVALLLLLGLTVYDAEAPEAALSLAGTLALGAAAFAGMGFGLASLIRSSEGASPIVNVIVLPMAFLSGSFGPTADYPQILQWIASVLPLEHFLELVRRTSLDGDALWEMPGHIAVVVAWGVAGYVVAARRFRWSPVAR